MARRIRTFLSLTRSLLAPPPRPAAEGSSDDIDQAVRRLFADQELVRSNGLMSLNSVNISRVVVQLAHFIYAYLQLSGLEGAEGLPGLEVVVPTGGAGNIAGEGSPENRSLLLRTQNLRQEVVLVPRLCDPPRRCSGRVIVFPACSGRY